MRSATRTTVQSVATEGSWCGLMGIIKDSSVSAFWSNRCMPIDEQGYIFSSVTSAVVVEDAEIR